MFAHFRALIYIRKIQFRNTQLKLLDDHVSGSENLEIVFYRLSLP